MDNDWEYELYNPITGQVITRFNIREDGDLFSENGNLEDYELQLSELATTHNAHSIERMHKPAITKEDKLEALRGMAFCDVRRATKKKEVTIGQ